MKLFSESTNSLKQEEKENNVDPNYKGEDLPFLIAETVRTSMEVDGFVHKINTEADQFIMESAESKGIDLESESEERTSLIMEAAFGEGQDEGIIQKVVDFIKKMYRKVADFVKGILGRFQNVEKLLNKAVEDYARVGSKLDGVTLPSDAEVKTKEIEVEGAAKVAEKLFKITTLFDLVVNNVQYNALGEGVKNMFSDDQDMNPGTFKKKVQKVNSELGGTNNEAAQHKLLTKYLKSVSKGLLTLKSDDVNETNTQKDPKKAVTDAAYGKDSETLEGSEIRSRFDTFEKELNGTLDPSKIRTTLSEGKKAFEDKADEFDKAAQDLEKTVAKKEEDDSVNDSTITDLTAALNNYSSVVGVYTSVTTTVYTFAVQFIQEWLNRARAYAKDVEKVAEKEGENKEE